MAAVVSPEQLAARQRLSGGARIRSCARIPGIFANVDWSKTRAYALGLNGLYINLKGREKIGTVDPGDRAALVAEIAAKLLATIDPATGHAGDHEGLPARQRSTRLAGHEDIAPDSIVGYAKGTRGSDESALGGLPPRSSSTTRIHGAATTAWTPTRCRAFC